ncbi:metal dependent phosphohydrolase [Candidatus Koribacter versatilis Ellin345]|uniref:Metal dependent phosphohydrolase n=1 Tax=Koribacter versatilis (strain Ellin345) TaxID=204669 RepID=Q1IUE8_KORVE|nr:CCA tRNA nucleotidyltransferase [Candidatus Koribacter versatilis]ABF39502.1 metal dependent phosphohydrolase [Candidatus Koribacter versatilis Ellin345]
MQPKAAAIEIVKTLRGHGHQAYLVGGCVRDLLLGRDPADYDVATDAIPDQVMKIFPKTWAVGAQFGVVLVPVPDEPECDPEATHPQSHHHGCIEVATFRSDGVYSDGRHPDEVRFSQDPREDVQRRDFTINGMLLDPLNHDEVLDFVGGRADLAAKIIRTIGDPRQRFEEDKLRMLRAVRFAARFEYEIAPETMAVIQQLSPQISVVSHERVRDELTKMLTEGHARRAFELLDESGLLIQVLPEIAKMKGVQQPPQFHPEGDVWIHTLMLLEQLPPNCSPTLAWGALLHDVGKPPTFRRAPDRIRFDGHVDVGVRMTEVLGKQMRFSNEQLDQVSALVENHMKFAEVTHMRESTLKRFMRLPKFDEHMELHKMDCLASHRNLGSYDFLKQKMEETQPKEIRPEPLVTGADLIALGHRPGPLFKEILSSVEDGQLEGRLQSREQAMAFVQAEFPL